MYHPHRIAHGKALFCLLLTLLLAVAAFGALAEDVEGKVIGGKLHLRDGASPDSRIIATYDSNTTVEIVGEENGYYQVKMPDGKTGFMETRYIYTDDSGAGSGTGEPAQVIGGELHLREEPDLTSAIIAAYETGTKVTVLGEEGDFYRVSLGDGKTGYMEKEYIHVPSEDSGYTSMAGRVISTWTNLRKEPSLESDMIEQYVSGATMDIDAKSGDFYHVTMEDGKTGYMETEFVYAYDTDTDTRSLYPTGVLKSELNLREGPSEDSAILNTYQRGTKVQIINEKDGFYHVYMHDGTTGYMDTLCVVAEDSDING